MFANLQPTNGATDNFQVKDIEQIGERVHVEVEINKTAASIYLTGYKEELYGVQKKITKILDKLSGMLVVLW